MNVFYVFIKWDKFETDDVQFTELGQRSENQPKLSYGREPSVVGDGGKLSFVVSDSGEGILPRNKSSLEIL